MLNQILRRVLDRASASQEEINIIVCLPEAGDPTEADPCIMLFANASFSESDSYVLVTTDTGEIVVPITHYDEMRPLLLKYPQIVAEVERINAISEPGFEEDTPSDGICAVH